MCLNLARRRFKSQKVRSILNLLNKCSRKTLKWFIFLATATLILSCKNSIYSLKSLELELSTNSIKAGSQAWLALMIIRFKLFLFLRATLNKWVKSSSKQESQWLLVSTKILWFRMISPSFLCAISICNWLQVGQFRNRSLKLNVQCVQAPSNANLAVVPIHIHQPVYGTSMHRKRVLKRRIWSILENANVTYLRINIMQRVRFIEISTNL